LLANGAGVRRKMQQLHQLPIIVPNLTERRVLEVRVYQKTSARGTSLDRRGLQVIAQKLMDRFRALPGKMAEPWVKPEA